jgi:hypothetical protein
MATKPASSFTIATNANYTAGARVGSPTKIAPGDLANGFTPGVAVTPEDHNYLYAILGDWSVWLLAGSAFAGLDAHVVETDSAGHTRIASLALGGTASGTRALVVNQNTGASSAAGTFTNSGAGFAVLASAAGASAAVRGLATGSGAGVEARVVGGTGPALTASRPAAAGPAGVFEKSGSGTPARGTIYLEPDVDPSAPVDGDVWKTLSTGFNNHGKLKYNDVRGGDQSVWSTAAGFGYAWFDAEGDQANNTTDWEEALVGQLSEDDNPLTPPGDYVVTVSLLAYGNGANPGTHCWVRVLDHTATMVCGIVKVLAEGTTEPAYPVSMMFKTTLAASTVQNYTVEFKSSVGGEEVRVKQVRMFFRGAYD